MPSAGIWLEPKKLTACILTFKTNTPDNGYVFGIRCKKQGGIWFETLNEQTWELTFVGSWGRKQGGICLDTRTQGGIWFETFKRTNCYFLFLLCYIAFRNLD